MTFDQIVYGLSGNDSNEKMTVSEIIRLIEILRQEYAPTVEMTKDKVKELNSIVHEVGDEFEQDELPDDESIRTTDKMIELESGFVLLKDLNVILHPETIKIVDE